MPNELDPIVGQWYAHLDKGQRFYVTTISDADSSVEIQHFDGDLEEFSFDEWGGLDIELSDEPENWAGPLDIGEKDDLGTEVTDTQDNDWIEPGEDFKPPDR